MTRMDTEQDKVEFLPSAIEADGSFNFPEVSRRYQTATLPRKRVDRERVANAFHDAFDLIGGVPRLALWAHQDPGEFYKLYSKLMPQQIKQEFDGKLVIVSAVKPTAIDGEFTEAEVVEEEQK